MAPLPTMSLRCQDEHKALIRDLARALRTRPDLAGTIAALLADDAGASASQSPVLADVVARLDAVERWIAGRNMDAMPRDAARTSSADTPERSLIPPHQAGSAFQPKAAPVAEGVAGGGGSIPRVQAAAVLADDDAAAADHQGVAVRHPVDVSANLPPQPAGPIPTDDFLTAARAAMKSLDLTYAALGEMVGIPKGTIGHMLRGRAPLDEGRRAVIATALGIPLDGGRAATPGVATAKDPAHDQPA